MQDGDELMLSQTNVKSILSPVRHPEELYGAHFAFDVYRGCPHACIYCAAASDTYDLDAPDVIIDAKVNAVELLAQELVSKKEKCLIATGVLSDPYCQAEERFMLTRMACECVLRHGFHLHICTKSDMILRDIDIFKRYKQQLSVSFSFTAFNEKTALALEPDAPAPVWRFDAMRELSRLGIVCGAVFSPVLPFLTDTEENLQTLITACAACGAQFVTAFYGVNITERQRKYFYRRLEACRSGLAERYAAVFGGEHVCLSPYAKDLSPFCRSLAQRHHMGYGMRAAAARISGGEQLSLFEE